MEVKNFVMMAVTLIIGVILISGVVAPVIADVSDDSGSGSGETYTNTGDMKHTFTDANTNLSIYPYVGGTNEGGYSFEPDSVTDRTGYLGEAQFYTEDGRTGAVYTEDSPITLCIYINNSSDEWYADQVDVVGTNMTFTPNGETTAVTIPISMIENPEGNAVVVANVNDDYLGETFYANANSRVYCSVTVMTGPTSGCQIEISGTVGNNTATLVDGSPDVTSVGQSAVFTIEDNQITGVTVTVNGTEYNVPVALPDDSTHTGFAIMILPVEVSDGSGSGGSISPTLSALLSVIPLLLTVGLVIGAIAFMRMRN